LISLPLGVAEESFGGKQQIVSQIRVGKFAESGKPELSTFPILSSNSSRILPAQHPPLLTPVDIPHLFQNELPKKKQKSISPVGRGRRRTFHPGIRFGEWEGGREKRKERERGERALGMGKRGERGNRGLI